MATTLKYRFAMRRRSAVDWTALNEVLLQSEWGHESDTNRLKIGDGVTPWVDLPYSGPSPTGVTAGEYGMDPMTVALVGFSVDEDGQLIGARSVPFALGDGLSFDIDPTTGAVTLSLVVAPVFTLRVTRDGSTRTTRSGNTRIIR